MQKQESLRFLRALQCAIQECSNLEMDWLWLASQLSNPQEQRYCYQQALRINPTSELACAALKQLESTPISALLNAPNCDPVILFKER